MKDRVFSDSVQYQVVMKNLEENNGQIKCAVCNRVILSKSGCHFDHIVPWAKGGKSTLPNCQILCSDCNIRKNDKILDDFLLEEKAKRFLSGEEMTDIETQREPTDINNETNEISKETFDLTIQNFISKYGDIKKTDFFKEKYKLPSIHHVRKYYGSLINLKKAFGMTTHEWNRENIKTSLHGFISTHGDILQKDLIKANGLPSLPCIFAYYPEYKTFTEIKEFLGLHPTRIVWTKDLARKKEESLLLYI